MAKNVKFNIRLLVDGREQLVTASTNVQGLAKQLGIATDKTAKLRDTMLALVQANVAFSGVASAVRGITSAVSSLTDINTANVEAETRLRQAMENTMAARQSDVESVKRLCEQQQRLGVISQGVQAAGAQQLASFLQERESLEKLIPVMNDLAVKQYGLSVSAEGAAGVAKMLGKAMTGQVSALTRAGITFTDAQAAALKFGTEEERAAALAEIVEAKVGGMNEALAQTDAGRAKQMSNALDDVKARLGAIIAPMQGVLSMAGGIAAGLATVGQAAAGIAGVTKAVKALQLAQVAATVATKAQSAAQSVAAGVQKLWASAVTFANRMQVAWTFGAKAFVVQAVAMRVAIAGLLTISGVGIAIAAVSAVLTRFSAASRQAKAAAEDLKAGEDAYTEAAARAKTEITDHIKKLRTVKDGTAEASAAVRNLNETYGPILGTYQTVAQWLKVLTERQGAYVKAIGLEAQQREIATRLAEKQVKLETSRQKLADLQKAGKATRNEYQVTGVGVGTTQTVETKEAARLRVEQEHLTDEIAALEKEQGVVDKLLGTALSGIGESAETNSTALKKEYSTINEINAAIKELQARQGDASLQESQSIQKEINALEERKKAFTGASSSPSAAVPAAVSETAPDAMPERLETLQDYNTALKILRERQQTCNSEEYQALQAQIDKVNEERDAFMGLQKEEAKEEWRPASIDKLNTLGDLSDAIDYYQRQQQQQSLAEAQSTQQTINLLKAKAKAMQSALDLPAIEEQTKKLQGLSGGELEMQLRLIGADDVRKTLLQLQTLLATAPDDQRAELEALVDQWKKYSSAVGISRDSSNAASEGLNAIGQTMQSLSGVMGEEAQQWMQWGATVLQSVASAIPAIASLVAAKKSEANANAEAAVTGAASSVASIPFVGWIMAAAAIASVVAALATIPKFAAGGIVGGPTYALVGEYAGAQNNPEVIAPLDRLRSLIEPRGLSGDVTFKIKGRNLVGVIDRETTKSNRS